MITLIYRIYQIVFAIPVFFLWTLFICEIIIIGTLCGGGKFCGYYPGKWWGWFVIRMLFLPVKVEGKENLKKGQSYVFLANHQGVEAYGVCATESHYTGQTDREIREIFARCKDFVLSIFGEKSKTLIGNLILRVDQSGVF